MSGPAAGGVDRASVERALGVPLGPLASDSRKVGAGDTFLAWPGRRSDGRDHIGEAVRAGAAAVLWEPGGFEWPDGVDVPNMPVEDLAGRAGPLAAEVWEHPSRDMTVVAVTGTNGKTTTAWILADLLARTSGGKVGLFGTVGAGVFGDLGPCALTTPDPVALQRGLAEVAAAGARHAVVEATSHALDQRRLDGVDCDIAVFTNISRDHLDYHGTFDAYARAKSRLFERAELRAAAVNADDRLGREIAARLDGRVSLLTYGERRGDVRVTGVSETPGGLVIDVSVGGRAHEWRTAIQGRFNAMNAVAAAAAASLAGIRWGEILPAMAEVGMPPGRMQRVGDPGRGPAVFVDFAHTPDALAKALGHLRAAHSGARVTCVFGCGGDRDRGKRAEMGRVASSLCDRVVVTTDNPRGEDPESIIADVMAGAGANASAVPDRAQAIFSAVRGSAAGDAVLVAGKGHERFQLVGDRRVPFDDAGVAAAALGEIAP